MHIEQIKQQIINDSLNQSFTKRGIDPLFSLSPKSTILIIGQAPGLKAMTSQRVFNDRSGDTLRSWLGVSKDVFYNTDIFGIMPMDFYYPGKGKTGDLSPRVEFAKKYHPLLLKELTHIKLIILVGKHAQDFYLNDKTTLTNRVKNYQHYLPTYFPLPHPSPLNFRWIRKNPFFQEVLSHLKTVIQDIIK